MKALGCFSVIYYMIFGALLLGSQIACCPYDFEFPTMEQPNEIITLSIGEDFSVNESDLTFSISAIVTSTLERDYSYQWSVLSNDELIISNPNDLTTSITNFSEGTYTLEFTLTTQDNTTHTANITLTVEPQVNASPLVEIIGENTISLPQNSLSLTSSATDIDGQITRYQWEAFHPLYSVELSNTNSPTTQLTGLIEGEYIVQLTVTDNNEASTTQSITLSVLGLPNLAPLVNVGENITLTLPQASLSLTATATDEDGTITHYLWEISSNQNVVELTENTSSTVFVSNLTEGIYTLQLTVTDNDAASTTQSITISVLPKPNEKPIIEEITDLYITLPCKDIIIIPIVTDDGSIESYQWEIINAAEEVVLLDTKEQLTLPELEAGSYSVSLTVIDDGGAYTTESFSLIVSPTNDRNILWKWYLKGLTTNREKLNWRVKHQSNSPLNEWTGVTEVDEDGRIIKLELIETYLSGEIIPEIWKLNMLKHLSLRKNNFEEIPMELFDITTLEVLSFSENNISSIPYQIGQLSQLRDLFLSNNNLDNTSIPEQVWELSTLERLSLLGNQLTYIPAELGDLVNLTWLELYRNRLMGEVPTSLSKLTKLNLLRLYDNSGLTGTLPGNLCKTTILEIHNTGLNCD